MPGKPVKGEENSGGRPVRVQRELGVVSRLRESSLKGRGRVSTWGSGTGWESKFRPVAASAEHTSITDCSAHRRTPACENVENQILSQEENKKTNETSLHAGD